MAAERAEMPGQVVDGTFVEPALREIRSDMLFRARLRPGGDAFLFVMIEHNSAPHPDILLQLLGHMLEIWRRHVGSAKGRALRLAPIVPVVVYNGSREWRIPLSLRDCIAGTGGSAEMSRSFTFRLRDLAREDSGVLSRDGVLHALLSLLRSVYQMRRLARCSGRLLRRSAVTGVGHVGVCVYTADDELDARGRCSGRPGTLLWLLSRRFGEVPPAVRTRVLAASERDLDAWTDAVLEAGSLDGVPATTPG